LTETKRELRVFGYPVWQGFTLDESNLFKVLLIA